MVWGTKSFKKKEQKSKDPGIVYIKLRSMKDKRAQKWWNKQGVLNTSW